MPLLVQCKNCNKRFKDLYKLRRHYLSYLPFYFGTYMCIECGVNFDTELKLINHIIKKKHSNNLISNFDFASKRKAYFDKEDNKYVGISKSKFDQSDIEYFLKQKGITNLDLNDVIAQLSTLDMDFNNRSVTSALYDMNSNPAITSFDPSILRKPNTKPTCTATTSFDSAILINSNDSSNYFPPPPVTVGAKRRNTVTTTPYGSNISSITLEGINRSIHELDIKIDNVERNLTSEIKSAKEEILAKLDQMLQYQFQLSQSLNVQIKSGVNESLTKMMNGAVTPISVSHAQTSQNQ